MNSPAREQAKPRIVKSFESTRVRIELRCAATTSSGPPSSFYRPWDCIAGAIHENGQQDGASFTQMTLSPRESSAGTLRIVTTEGKRLLFRAENLEPEDDSI